MANDDAKTAGTQGDRRLHRRQGPDPDDVGPDEAGVVRDRRQHDSEGRRLDPDPEPDRDRHGEDQWRERGERVDHPHQDAIGEPGGHPGDEPDEAADGEAADHDREPDGERESGPVDEAREHVPPVAVRSHGMGQRRWLEDGIEIDEQRIDVPDRWTERRRQEQGDEQPGRRRERYVARDVLAAAATPRPRRCPRRMRRGAAAVADTLAAAARRPPGRT